MKEIVLSVVTLAIVGVLGLPQASAATGLAGTHEYYVSPKGSDATGDGSASKPWATIAYAASWIGPGATVHVAAGVYIGSSKTYAAGSPEARITYVSDVKWGAKLVGTKGSTWANHGDYVDIVNFDVTGPGLNGIYTDANSTRIIGNHVHDMPVACTGTGGSGINLNGTNAEVESNYVHDIGAGYPKTCSYVHGIYFLKSGGHAYNNIGFRIVGWGIQLWHNPHHLVLANNTFFKSHGGILVGNDETSADYVSVINNICTDNERGIREEGTTGIHNIYSNNLVFGNSVSAILLQNGLLPKQTVAAAPLFVNYTGDATGDYHLRAGSPAIDAGTQMEAPLTDFDGVKRPQGRAWDIGAYEYVPSSASRKVSPPRIPASEERRIYPAFSSILLPK